MDRDNKIEWLKSEIKFLEEMLVPEEYKIKMMQEYKFRKEIAEKELEKLLAEEK